jgi:hypothetical protein
MTRRLTKNGKVHAHSQNIQDFPRMELPPGERALWAFLTWADLRPGGVYYDLLPPTARMAVDAVKVAADKLSVIREENKK